MDRAGYSDDCTSDDVDLWRGEVAAAIDSKHGQSLLRELAVAMDAIPEKVLIAKKLIDDEGDCCTIGVICKARGLNINEIDHQSPGCVAAAIGAPLPLVAEIEHLNDYWLDEDPRARWHRMRTWVWSKIKNDGVV